jgi:uncharacterized membrane protein
MVTGQLATALAVGSIEPFIKLIVYYVHERAWQRVPIGTVRRLARWRRATDRETVSELPADPSNSESSLAAASCTDGRTTRDIGK